MLTATATLPPGTTLADFEPRRLAPDPPPFNAGEWVSNIHNLSRVRWLWTKWVEANGWYDREACDAFVLGTGSVKELAERVERDFLDFVTQEYNEGRA